jgi:hypothetical protein
MNKLIINKLHKFLNTKAPVHVSPTVRSHLQRVSHLKVYTTLSVANVKIYNANMLLHHQYIVSHWNYVKIIVIQDSY